MPFIYSDASGKIVRVTLNQFEDEHFGPPASYAELLEYDPDTNAVMIADLNLNWNSYTLIGGILRHNGIVITITPPTEEHIAQTNAKTGFQILDARYRDATPTQIRDAITNNVWGGLTKAQANTWLDQNITGTTINTLRPQIIAAFKLVAGAVIDLRDLMAIEGLLLGYIRDLVIKYRNWLNTSMPTKK